MRAAILGYQGTKASSGYGGDWESGAVVFLRLASTVVEGSVVLFLLAVVSICGMVPGSEVGGDADCEDE
jgi:hypothetical protein